ncbi:hypothetical protein [Amycolatopsis sp. cmx-4-83]|uniref:hypothetical protein n=1 Tax=Amycolatopsis sp. cmx-4-83 TaxID=2790940 RepID=UPI00397E03DF
MICTSSGFSGDATSVVPGVRRGSTVEPERGSAAGASTWTARTAAKSLPCDNG